MKGKWLQLYMQKHKKLPRHTIWFFVKLHIKPESGPNYAYQANIKHANIPPNINIYQEPDSYFTDDSLIWYIEVPRKLKVLKVEISTDFPMISGYPSCKNNIVLFTTLQKWKPHTFHCHLQIFLAVSFFLSFLLP